MTQQHKLIFLVLPLTIKRFLLNFDTGFDTEPKSNVNELFFFCTCQLEGRKESIVLAPIETFLLFRRRRRTYDPKPR